ncbi:MAG: hypothetical protein KGL35_22280 [Bradyrhizobium sp.]|uniref:hypothetical protein n=1 Tax=Bradyrhizobium sp. TaxID=376 RepID=UPI00238E92A4|nr:hypothetical protein [Bradyrhizobium sp.]MDE2067513.1 hypothetical protein [Bradyrhizobium sp.]MDE2471382.1 hypothetical protein [Bradyrhizobium sp.]
MPDRFIGLLLLTLPAVLPLVVPFDIPVVVPDVVVPGDAAPDVADPVPPVPAPPAPAAPPACASANVLESANAVANARVLIFMVVSLVENYQEETR